MNVKVRKIYSERKKLKSPFTTTPHSFDAPSPATPANIRINLTLLETRFPVLQFCRSNFRTVFSESQKRQLIIAEPETDVNAKWSFKVIYFDVTEEQL